MRCKFSILVITLSIITSIFLDKVAAGEAEDSAVRRSNFYLFRGLMELGYNKLEILEHGRSVFVKFDNLPTPGEVNGAEANAGAMEFTHLILVKKYPIDLVQQYGKAGVVVLESNFNLFRTLMAKRYTRKYIEQNGTSRIDRFAEPLNPREVDNEDAMAGAAVFTNLILVEKYSMRQVQLYGESVRRFAVVRPIVRGQPIP